MTVSAYETIVAYHEATKHHFHRYARSAGYMDWANQPNPFRRYEGVAQISLGIPNTDPALTYADLYTPAHEAGDPLNVNTLSTFLALSLGLSAWKKAGNSRWALRINPSSGNLHPTEAHLILPTVPGMEGGIFHYFSYAHALERRADLPKGHWPYITDHFGGFGFLAVLSTIFWRESWKYGERAYRYCNLDAGHAVAALSFAARLHNWTLTCLNGAGDGQIRSLLGFDRTGWHPLEEEVPELVCWVSTNGPDSDTSQALPVELVRPFADQKYFGVPNQLSRQPVDWSIITRASNAIEKPETAPESEDFAAADQPTYPSKAMPAKEIPAAQVIRQRRSAVNYNPQQSISLEVFQSILSRALPRTGVPPFSVNVMPSSVHLLLFVHRVDDLSPGFYLLARRTDHVDYMRANWRKDFLWQRMWSDFPLYSLKEMDATAVAMELSCHQEIAGDSAFAVAMIAKFKDHLHQTPYKYRHLHWECGMIGQVLYLEAEAHGMRGTGIGCFFDDPVHQLLGITDNAFQTLYHFTVGHPIEDTRLETLPAYHHLGMAGS
jgi:SagB-type dehydrogenase family enzyme